MDKECGCVTCRCSISNDTKITSDCPKDIESITVEMTLESWRRTAIPKDNDEVEKKAYKIIKRALEKQIPKDAQETQEDMEIEKICSVCKHGNTEYAHYCHYCGQKFGATIGVF